MSRKEIDMETVSCRLAVIVSCLLVIMGSNAAAQLCGDDSVKRLACGDIPQRTPEPRERRFRPE
jgi:hypothetical protein